MYSPPKKPTTEPNARQYFRNRQDYSCAYTNFDINMRGCYVWVPEKESACERVYRDVLYNFYAGIL